MAFALESASCTAENCDARLYAPTGTEASAIPGTNARRTSFARRKEGVQTVRSMMSRASVSFSARIAALRAVDAVSKGMAVEILLGFEG